MTSNATNRATLARRIRASLLTRRICSLIFNSGSVVRALGHGVMSMKSGCLHVVTGCGERIVGADTLPTAERSLDATACSNRRTLRRNMLAAGPLADCRIPTRVSTLVSHVNSFQVYSAPRASASRTPRSVVSSETWHAISSTSPGSDVAVAEDRHRARES
jgi:hypothetical protein